MTQSPVDTYIAGFPPATQQALKQIRQTIKTAVPDAAEVISYGIPTFRLGKKNLVHYGGFAEHVGFYATPDGQKAFEAELATYKRGKGSVQFPLAKPMPLDLVRRVSLFRAELIRSQK